MSVLKIKKPDGTWESINNNSIIEVDTTLTQRGKAADAKAVGDKINDLPNIVVQPDEPSNPADGMLWLDTDAESSSGGSGGSSNILIGEFVINTDNVTIIPVDEGRSNLQLNENLMPTLTAIFDACDNYKLPPFIQVSSNELSFAYMCNYLSGTYREIQSCFVRSITDGTMTLCTCRDDGLILTNNNIVTDMLNENFDITVRIYVNSGVAYSLGEGATF